MTTVMNEPIAADVQKYPAHAAFTVHDCLGFGSGIDLGVGLDFGLEASFLSAIFTNLQTHSLRVIPSRAARRSIQP